MNFCINFSNIVFDNLYFIKPVKNKIKKNGIFYKLYYDNNYCIINNFIMQTDMYIDKIKNNILINNHNLVILEKINKLEIFLLKKILKNDYNKNKKKFCFISDNLLNNRYYININSKKKCYFNFDENKKKINIKINGIWEDENNIGFSYNIYIH
tara:strand:- start:3701 stop:4162 length:462 start_codon:yes stop_codon:yes gene_type:complete